MTRDVARLERLVSSLRDVAIVERQIETDAMEAVDLAGVLRDTVDGAQRRAGSRASIVLHASGVGRVRASRERLAQVFENLLANAVSFAPDGTTIDVHARERGGETVVTFEDRGPGIPESHLDRVFARFFTYRPVEGRGDHVGLGLAIARQIVESYGGSIAASNREGGGACFTVRFPPASHATLQ
jgi:two-component system sensor histidine kinase ChvG